MFAKKFLTMFTRELNHVIRRKVSAILNYKTQNKSVRLGLEAITGRMKEIRIWATGQ